MKGTSECIGIIGSLIQHEIMSGGFDSHVYKFPFILFGGFICLKIKLFTTIDV